MVTCRERRIQISAPWMRARHEAEKGGHFAVCFVEYDWELRSMLSGFVHVVSGSTCGFVRKLFFFLLLLPLVTPNMHSFAPNHNTVGTLPQSASCNLRAAAKSKCCWWKQHLLSIGSAEKSPTPAHCFYFSKFALQHFCLSEA